jgi:hypothetical protein
VTTLVISDLHLGSLGERDVLRRPLPLEILEEAARRADRLVLLGDTLELLEGRPEAAAVAGRAVLTRLGAALGPEGEVVVVPGNHDHALIRPWLHRRIGSGTPLRPATQVPKGASTLLGELCTWLRPARVEVRYPGVWLGERVYATHGHYLDRLLPSALRGRLRDLGEDDPRAAVDDFERVPGSDAGALQEVLATALPDGLGEQLGTAAGQARRAIASGLPLLAQIPGMREAASFGALVMEQQIHRRGAIPAMDEVARRLRLRADWLIFGHIHRRGPLPADPTELWRPRADGPHLVNSGSWVFDSALAGTPRPDGAPRPYRPGGAVLIEDGRNPRPLDLLAAVPDRMLRGRL